MASTQRHPAVFLTGASNGIGRAVALRLIRDGYEVWGTSRDKSRLADIPGIHPVELDFLIPGSVAEAWNQALAEAGRIDIVIQNAGYGIFGSVEETGIEASRKQWISLVEGPALLLRLAASHMRPRRSGWIIGISSLAAEMPIPFFAHYSAGKAAFSSLLEGLWMELKPFGVRVVDLRPGDIQTSFNEVALSFLPDGSSYSSWAQQAWKESCRLIRAAPGPHLVGEKVVAILQKKNPRSVYRCGSFFQCVLGPLGVRIFSKSYLLRTIRRYYGLHRHDIS